MQVLNKEVSNPGYSTDIIKRIDYTLMVVLSFFCLAYISPGGKIFAEINVQFPFLGFPVFVGEFLLMGCVVLLLMRAYLLRTGVSFWQGLIIVYICFFVFKAILGFSQYGPLAFRHAALFYYGLFAVIGYYCYRPEFFKWWVILISIGILHGMYFSPKFNEFWLMPRVFMGLILAYKFPDRRVGVLLAASVLLWTPYQYFLDTSRAIILANFVSVSFLITASALAIGQKKQIFFLIGSCFLVALFGWYVFFLSGNKYAQGLVSIDKLKYMYEDTDMAIRQKKDSFKSQKILRIGLYSPEKSVLRADAALEPQGSSTVIPAENAVLPDSVGSNRDRLIREMKIGNSVFRLLIWRDAKKELVEQKPMFGFDFGKPFRSESLETVRWGIDDWGRDGWIAMHNSYLEILYRSGMVGIALIAGMLAVFVYCVMVFIRLKSAVGLLLCACLTVPVVAANFSVSLELPHTAIPVWTLYGLILAYAHSQLRVHKSITGPQRT